MPRGPGSWLGRGVLPGQCWGFGTAAALGLLLLERGNTPASWGAEGAPAEQEGDAPELPGTPASPAVPQQLTSTSADLALC